MPSYENRNGKWSVRFRLVGEDGTVNKRLSGYKTKKDATQAYVAFMNSIDEHKEAERLAEARKAGEIRFRFIYEEYVKSITPSNRIPTMTVYKSKCETHILPYFGEMKMEEITPLAVLKWKETVSHLAYSYKQRLLSMFKTILRFGNLYYGTPDISPLIEPYKRTFAPKKEMQIWTVEEFDQVMSVIPDEEYIFKAFYTLLFYSGLREGEALALTWADLCDGCVNVTKSVSYKVAGGGMVVTPPKTACSVRKVSLPSSVRLIVERLSRLKKTALSDFIFKNPNTDRPLPPQTLRRKLEDYATKAGVKPIRVHDLRHSHASLLVRSGCNIVAIARRLGHSDIEMTLNTYSHKYTDDDTLIMEALNKEFLR